MQSNFIKNEIEAAAVAGNVLFENHKFVVIHAYASELPHTLQAIGRLRELNFRMVGEGTGKDIDLDQFDEHYIQVVAWNKKSEDISGAARLGEINKIYNEKSFDGIYSCLEFKFDKALIEKFKTTVELSRLFVNSTGQKNYFGLYLIFCGITNWMAKSNYYTHLLGSVSISKTIPPQIHGIIIDFCRKNYFDEELSKLINAYQPANFNVEKEILRKLEDDDPKDFEALDKFIENHYNVKNQIPILFKKYHLFAAKYLAFGIDDDFSSVTDPLIHVSFADSEEKTLAKFMDKDLLPVYLKMLGR